ncbi:MAG: YidC/Oxa1 family membrane protein insertase [Patescibacteria group bacterium]
MFTTLVVQPLFNLLALIYALIPGHNFGLALIIFTIIIRLALWPMVKKQLHQAKAMRKLQPEIKRVKKATKGNRAQESQMLMELYKERGINPFATFPTLIVQFIILIGLYSGLNKLIHDPNALVTFTYPFVQGLPWMEQLAKNIHLLDNTLFGFVDLSRAALGKGGVYWPAMFLVIGSAVAQFYQTKQLMPSNKDGRSLRTILKEAGTGKQADQSEVNAAVFSSTKFLLPVMIFVFTVNLASALSLYWFVGGIVAYIQQSIVLNKDEEEMEAIADKPDKKKKNLSKIPEAEIVSTNTKKPTPKAKKQTKKRRKKR